MTLFTYTKFSKEQINAIADAYIYNNQIGADGDLTPEYNSLQG